MTELDELIRKSESFSEEKSIPYLGWFWREFPDYTEEVTLSLLDDYVYIDNANKWDYPSCHTTKEDGLKIKELIKIISEKRIELGEVFNKYKKQLESKK